MATALTGYSIQRNEIFDIMHKHQKDVIWGNGARNEFLLYTEPDTANPKWSVRIGDTTRVNQLFQCTIGGEGVHHYSEAACTDAGGTWNASVVPSTKYEFVFTKDNVDMATNPSGKLIIGVPEGVEGTTLQAHERVVVRFREKDSLGDGGLLYQLAKDMTQNPYGLPDRFLGNADLNNKNGKIYFYLSSTETNITVKISTFKDANGNLLSTPTETTITEVSDGTSPTPGVQNYIYHGVTATNLEPYIEFINLDLVPSIHQEVIVEYTPLNPKSNGFRLIHPASVDDIENTFVVESYGCDVLSDDAGIQASLKKPSGGGFSKQSWRIRFHYDYGIDELVVNVGTKYQILDNGQITRSQERDGLASEIMRTPGELCDLYYIKQLGKSGSSVVNHEFQKAKSGFFRRVGKTVDEFSATYPISYRLTVTDHGVGFFMWDQAAVEQEDDYAWFVVQRHVDNTTGEVDWGDQVGTQSPVHCVYSPYKRPVDLNDMTPYYNAQDLYDATKLGDIYSASGTELDFNHAAVSSNFKFDGLVGIVDLTGGNRLRQFRGAEAPESTEESPDWLDSRVDRVADQYGNLYPFLDGRDSTEFNINWNGTDPLDSRLVLPIRGTQTDISSYPFEYGENDINAKPKSTNREVIIASMVVTINGVEVDRASDSSYIEVNGGIHKPVWSLAPNYGENKQQYLYDEEFHMLHFRFVPDKDADLVIRFNTYNDEGIGDQFYIARPTDKEIPETNLNVNEKSKAIYRFVVRETDVFKPWDVHKSATMHTTDSNAIINPLEQLAITSDRNFVFTFPTQMTTQRFYYPTSELDMICYSSANFSTFGGKIEIDKYLDSNGNENILYDSKYYDSNLGIFKRVDLATEAITERGYSNIKGSGVMRYRLGRKRVYEGMMSTLPNGNGMRIFLQVNGGSILDSDVPDGNFN